MTDFYGKIFAVYKPKGITSHDAINRLRRVTGERKIGHAGTLDPLAEGVLVVGVGREATKRLSVEVLKEKEYVAEVYLGATSTTDDEEGDKTPCRVAKIPDDATVGKILGKFVGEIDQVPPVFSAIKVKGRPAYGYARAGVLLKLPLRRVKILRLEVLNYIWPKLKIRVVCGPGVYVRSLSRDIGDMLGVCGYLSSLIRVRVGNYTIENSIKLDELGGMG